MIKIRIQYGQLYNIISFKDLQEKNRLPYTNYQFAMAKIGGKTEVQPLRLSIDKMVNSIKGKRIFKEIVAAAYNPILPPPLPASRLGSFRRSSK